MKKRWKIAIVCAALALVHVGILLHSSDRAQDDCSFDGIGRDQLEKMKQAVEFLNWRPLPWNAKAASGILKAKVSQITPTPITSDGTIAAVHVVLRSLGATFAGFSDSTAKYPNSQNIKRGFQYRYLLDVNRLFYFAPFFRRLLIIVTLRNPSSVIPQGEDNLSISTLFPSAIDPWTDFERSNAICPPVPKANR